MNAAKTSAERQREFRQRKSEAEATEVRGIFAHPAIHEQIKADAAKLNRRRARLVAKQALTSGEV
jgi:hypothetical protein